LNRDIGVGKNTVDRCGDGFHQLFGSLEGDGAGEADGEIGKVAIAGAPDADAADFEYAIHARNFTDNLGTNPGGSGIEQSIDGAPCQPPAHGNDHARDEKSRDRIGHAEPLQTIGASRQNKNQTEDNDTSGPDVGGKVECIGFQRLAIVFGGDAAQGAGAPVVHRHGDQHNDKGPDRRLDINAAEKQAHNRFVDDPDAGQQQQAGFDEGRKVFHFAVAVLMVGIGGLVGDSDGQIGQRGGDEIQRGVRGLGENAQAAGGNAYHDFSAGDQQGGENRVSQPPRVSRRAWHWVSRGPASRT
jgi:hypothetical protein